MSLQTHHHCPGLARSSGPSPEVEDGFHQCAGCEVARHEHVGLPRPFGHSTDVLEQYLEDEQELDKPTTLMESGVRQWGGKTGRDQPVHCHHYWRRGRALNGHSGVEDGGFGTPVRGQKGEEREGGVKVERPEPDIDSKKVWKEPPG